MTQPMNGARRMSIFLIAGAMMCGLLIAPESARAGECLDALITAGVKTRIMADDVIGAFKINVETDECVVTLNGCVDSKDQIKRARNLARRIKGVRAVKTNLTVCPAESEDE
jgi:hyperosmotically inducible periplasmic protein